MNKYLAIFGLLWICFSVKAQIKTSFPAEITEKAYAVIQSNEIDFICESATNALKKESYTVTVLDEKGKEAAHFLCMCDQFSSLNKFSGEVYDRTGNLIRKIKKSELKMSEYSSGLTTDDYMYFFECNIGQYPYTVKYEWEIKYKNGLISFPPFVPQSRFNLSVVEANYRLHVPAEVTYRTKILNSGNKFQSKTTPKGATYSEISFKNLKALEKELYGAPLEALIPIVYLGPDNFIFDGSQGDMSSWKSYGNWQYGLLKDRDILPPELKEKIHQLTSGCNSEKEKVKVLYDYLAANTRYVSIQLGIGGLQPTPATNVYKTGFGDCKALSNYLKAMLQEVGINSNYTVISTDRVKLLKDFASVGQMNHVILQVPLKEETLWLECTNAQLPLGYIHSDIAGHDAILIKENGGELCTLPSYPDSVNTQIRTAQITLDNNGKAHIQTTQKCDLFQYEHLSVITHMQPDEQKDLLRSQIRLTQASVNNISIQESKRANPQIDVQFQTECQQFGNKTGNRLFIPANLFRNYFTVPKQEKRTSDIYIKYGYADTDSVLITLPEGFVLEAMPKPTSVSCRFGSFESSIENKGTQICVRQRLFLKKGKFPANTYEEFANFAQTISDLYGGRIVLKKE